MKRTLIIIISILIAQYSIGQTKECDCNELFDKDLKDEYKSFSSQRSKEFLYKFFTSDQTSRQSIKNDNSIEASLGVVIEAIPIDLGFGSSSNSSNNKFNSIYKQAIDNKYVSDELLQAIYITALPKLSFSSYEQCLNLCKEVYNRAGISLRNISSQSDLIVLELRFKSTPSGGKISIKDAIYSAGTVIGRKKFDVGTEIIDGQVLYEHIKVRDDESITVTITFNEGGVNRASLSIESNNKKKRSSDAPLGTIVASILNYNDFLKLNGLESESDINKMIWVPCDGREIGTEEGTYGAYSGGKAPDLRGLFLRAVNDMGAYTATVPTPNLNHLNPKDLKAGQVQMDIVGKHKHSGRYQTHAGGVGGGKEHEIQFSTGKVYKDNDLVGDPIGPNSETRPKNISVYYYLKIR